MQPKGLIHIHIRRHQRLRILCNLMRKAMTIGMNSFYILILRPHLLLVCAQKNSASLSRQEYTRLAVLCFLKMFELDLVMIDK